MPVSVFLKKCQILLYKENNLEFFTIVFNYHNDKMGTQNFKQNQKNNNK